MNVKGASPRRGQGERVRLCGRVHGPRRGRAVRRGVRQGGRARQARGVLQPQRCGSLRPAEEREEDDTGEAGVDVPHVVQVRRQHGPSDTCGGDDRVEDSERKFARVGVTVGFCFDLMSVATKKSAVLFYRRLLWMRLRYLLPLVQPVSKPAEFFLCYVVEFEWSVD